MNQLVKDWIAALRSGKYKQSKLFLRDANGCYCATGVLCLVAGMKPRARVIGMILDGHSYSSYLPTAVIDATGLRLSVFSQVTRLNDRGHTFNEIADYIEEQARAA